eukprot:TRINITY_DN2010_c0_g1_i1.p1 TRINITY_DN2010_c0_g1~~TRINITY_DN2010_c0_g1_i1.p1  ORF type:complete len:564 (-),score=56.79 TRINITY_DN2010_c0_g1_i1:1356-3047(-)
MPLNGPLDRQPIFGLSQHTSHELHTEWYDSLLSALAVESDTHPLGKHSAKRSTFPSLSVTTPVVDRQPSRVTDPAATLAPSLKELEATAASELAASNEFVVRSHAIVERTAKWNRDKSVAVSSLQLLRLQVAYLEDVVALATDRLAAAATALYARHCGRLASCTSREAQLAAAVAAARAERVAAEGRAEELALSADVADRAARDAVRHVNRLKPECTRRRADADTAAADAIRTAEERYATVIDDVRRLQLENGLLREALYARCRADGMDTSFLLQIPRCVVEPPYVTVLAGHHLLAQAQPQGMRAATTTSGGSEPTPSAVEGRWDPGGRAAPGARVPERPAAAMTSPVSGGAGHGSVRFADVPPLASADAFSVGTGSLLGDSRRDVLQGLRGGGRLGGGTGNGVTVAADADDVDVPTHTQWNETVEVAGEIVGAATLAGSEAESVMTTGRRGASQINAPFRQALRSFAQTGRDPAAMAELAGSTRRKQRAALAAAGAEGARRTFTQSVQTLGRTTEAMRRALAAADIEEDVLPHEESPRAGGCRTTGLTSRADASDTGTEVWQ